MFIFLFRFEFLRRRERHQSLSSRFRFDLLFRGEELESALSDPLLPRVVTKETGDEESNDNHGDQEDNGDGYFRPQHNCQQIIDLISTHSLALCENERTKSEFEL